MKKCAFLLAVFSAFTVSINSALADTFGTGSNQFTIDFVDIGNAGNRPDATGFGAVPYTYRVSTYEISQDAITKATAGGMTNVVTGPWVPEDPARAVTWYEAAAFVNWLNTNTGHVAAYDLTWNGSAWSMNVWSNGAQWTSGGTNVYRNKRAYYFLPNDNEWYKAAYYSATDTFYYDYPTGGFNVPFAVASGTNPNTAVYNSLAFGPAAVTNAGGLSPYGTMGQGGNVTEWIESPGGTNDYSANSVRGVRGGSWSDSGIALNSRIQVAGLAFDPSLRTPIFGFRVASASSLPLPTTNVILTIEQTTNLSSNWQVAPITTGMITWQGELNMGAMTNTNEFYRLRIRTVVE